MRIHSISATSAGATSFNMFRRVLRGPSPSSIDKHLTPSHVVNTICRAHSRARKGLTVARCGTGSSPRSPASEYRRVMCFARSKTPRAWSADRLSSSHNHRCHQIRRGRFRIVHTSDPHRRRVIRAKRQPAGLVAHAQGTQQIPPALRQFDGETTMLVSALRRRLVRSANRTLTAMSSTPPLFPHRLPRQTPAELA